MSKSTATLTDTDALRARSAWRTPDEFDARPPVEAPVHRAHTTAAGDDDLAAFVQKFEAKFAELAPDAVQESGADPYVFPEFPANVDARATARNRPADVRPVALARREPYVSAVSSSPATSIRPRSTADADLDVDEAFSILRAAELTGRARSAENEDGLTNGHRSSSAPYAAVRQASQPERRHDSDTQVRSSSDEHESEGSAAHAPQSSGPSEGGMGESTSKAEFHSEAESRSEPSRQGLSFGAAPNDRRAAAPDWATKVHRPHTFAVAGAVVALIVGIVSGYVAGRDSPVAAPAAIEAARGGGAALRLDLELRSSR